MKTLRILTIASSAAATIFLSSCGCSTGEAKAPKLRSLPQFADIPVAPTK